MWSWNTFICLKLPKKEDGWDYNTVYIWFDFFLHHNTPALLSRQWVWPQDLSRQCPSCVSTTWRIFVSIILYLEQYTSIFSIHPINDFSLYFLNSVCQEKVHNYRIPSGVKTHNRRDLEVCRIHSPISHVVKQVSIGPHRWEHLNESSFPFSILLAWSPF